MTKPMTAGFRNFLIFQARIESHIARVQERKQAEKTIVKQQVTEGPMCLALPVRYNCNGVPIPY